MFKKSVHYKTFKKGSKTYFTSSLFFPPSRRDDVFKLYGFVRTADDFVDAVPQDSDGFYNFCSLYRRALGGKAAGDPIIDGFVELSRRKNFEPAWSDAFLRSMEADLTKNIYDSLDETLGYIYGSAEVIGLFMAKLMDLPPQSYRSAQMLGRAMQYINFIRDIGEDNSLGRRYLPLENTGLKSLEHQHCVQNREEFISFHKAQIELYMSWHNQAVSGYSYIPRRMRIPIKTAEDMYIWTARQIAKDPFIVFTRKVKPTKGRIIRQAVINIFTA